MPTDRPLISEQMFYVWKRKYAGRELSEPRKLWQLLEENEAEAAGGRSVIGPVLMQRGVPRVITADNDGEFASHVMDA